MYTTIIVYCEITFFIFIVYRICNEAAPTFFRRRR